MKNPTMKNITALLFAISIPICSLYAEGDKLAPPLSSWVKSAEATNVYGKKPGYDAAKAVDGNNSTRWATDSTVDEATLTVHFRKSREISKVLIREEYRRVKHWGLDLKVNGEWKPVCQGTSLGEFFQKSFPSCQAMAARLRITQSLGGPTISEIRFGVVGKERYEPTVESLQWYRCPQWIQDAKFGIYCHWNAQSAAKSRHNDWYARWMYEEGHAAYRDHVRNWGHPSKVGYKDVIKAWEAPKFDAEQWIRLFKEAGAKYVCTMAVHHDNFDMWDSKYQPKWNSTNYGPRKDVCRQMRDASLKHGMRWGVSTHLGRAYSWMQTNKGSDTAGPRAGLPYDGNDPAYKDLYFGKPDFSKLGSRADMLRHPLHTPQSVRTNWKNRMFDLIDNYHPDFFYFDGACPFMDDKGQSGLDVIAHYYNSNAKRHNGKNEGVMVIKDITRHGHYYPGVSSVVLERRNTAKIVTNPRITEQSVGDWFQSGGGYRSSKSLMHEMIDVISKNCIFKLNIPPMGDGSIDPACVKILKDFGQWLKINGSAFYATRPWHKFGEGNVRFTTKGNQLNVIALNQPGAEVIVVSAATWKAEDIKSIELLGEGPVEWSLSDKGLVIEPKIKNPQLAYTFQIACAKPAIEMSAKMK